MCRVDDLIRYLLSIVFAFPLIVSGHDQEAHFKCSGPVPNDAAGLLLHTKRLKSCMDGNMADCMPQTGECGESAYITLTIN